jgi:predicted nucleic acid-binding protein
MIASVSGWHEHHDLAANAIEDRLAAGHQMLVAAHSLVEMYSVMTRLPPGRRLSPSDARALVVESFVNLGTIISLSAQAYIDLLTWLESHGIAGGRTYDALIVAAAEAGGADTVLTLNARDFTALRRTGIEIIAL